MSMNDYSLDYKAEVSSLRHTHRWNSPQFAFMSLASIYFGGVTWRILNRKDKSLYRSVRKSEHNIFLIFFPRAERSKPFQTVKEGCLLIIIK